MDLENNENVDKEINNENLEDKSNETITLPEVSAAAAKALTKGWQTKEDWEKSGKDPEEWISASHFNKNGDIFTQMQGLKHSIKNQDKRISDNNVYWKGQLQIQRDELVVKRDEAIDEADKGAVNAIDKQINELDKTKAHLEDSVKLPQASNADLDIENQYFGSLLNSHTNYAQQAAAHYINNESLSGADLVSAVKAAVNKQFNIEEKPAVNERREKASVTDTKRSSGKRSEKVTVDTLTAADKHSLQAMRNISPKYANKSNAEMLKIINDANR